ncbi:MAG TPA: ABC transporter substrate binding protein [Anaeromyxobacteraceae bacterium]|nr:ABC transporter substrate binding protein [Anaeromyxobacteraceae bacterium]
MLRTRILWAVALLGCAVATQARAQGAGKKVVFVNSYHQGYEWSDGEEAGLKSVLGPAGVDLRVFYMDTKRNPDPKAQKEAGRKAKELIDALQPDAVIVADDNAAEEVLVQYYKNAKIPFVFCGVNWDASRYGLPYTNTTGMLEVGLVKELVDNLREYAKGGRVGLLAADTESQRVDGKFFGQLLNGLAREVYVKTFPEWKDQFQRMQGEVDILIVGNPAGITGWDNAAAADWALANGKVPSGTIHEFVMPYAMLGMTKIGQEQGIWTAKAVLEILKGKPAGSIPIVKNKEAKLKINVKLASKAGVVFKPALARNAEVVK